MTQPDPLVSVFMPTYNHEEFVAEAIESVLNQNYENLELVIGDDCSQDDTWQIIERYQIQYPEKITAFRNERNLGVTGNCNEVLQRCTGEYLVFHAGDDIFQSNKIRSQVDALESKSSNIFCYHDVEVFDSVTGRTKHCFNSGEQGVPAIEGETEEVVRDVIARGTEFMAAQSVMVDRDTIPDWGYDERIPVASDWLMWIDILARNEGTVVYLDEVLSRYRDHEHGSSGQVLENDSDQYVTLAIVESRYPRLRSAVRIHRGYLYYRDAVSSIADGDAAFGRAQLREGLRYSVYSWKWVGWWGYSLFKQYYEELNDKIALTTD